MILSFVKFHDNQPKTLGGVCGHRNNEKANIGQTNLQFSNFSKFLFKRCDLSTEVMSSH